MQGLKRIGPGFRRLRASALMCGVTAFVLGLFMRSAEAAYISEISAVPIAPDSAFTLDGTVATQSDLGWDLTYIDHSDFTQPYFADDLSDSAYFWGPVDGTPSFTTYGGVNNPGEATNTPYIYSDFLNGYLVTAGEPALFTIWLYADGPAEIDASLTDDSASLDPVDFDSPTEFQILVESDITQEVDFSAPADSDDTEDGLWAIAATASVPEPASAVLLLTGCVVLLARRAEKRDISESCGPAGHSDPAV